MNFSKASVVHIENNLILIAPYNMETRAVVQHQVQNVFSLILVCRDHWSIKTYWDMSHTRHSW